MDELDYRGMSIDAEGVTDEAKNSKLAFVAFFLLLVGFLAPIEWRLVFVSGAATFLALIALLMSKRETTTRLSKNLAIFVLFVGAMCTVWGTVVRQVYNNRQEQRATEVAQEYMDVLAEGQMLRAIKMVGLDPIVDDAERENEMAPAQKAVRQYMDDYAISKVIERGNAAKWVSKGVISHTQDGDMTIFTVRFLDDTRNNPEPYDVIVNFIPPSKYAVEKTYRWMVDRVEIPVQ